MSLRFLKCFGRKMSPFSWFLTLACFFFVGYQFQRDLVHRFQFTIIGFYTLLMKYHWQFITSCLTFFALLSSSADVTAAHFHAEHITEKSILK